VAIGSSFRFGMRIKPLAHSRTHKCSNIDANNTASQRHDGAAARFAGGIVVSSYMTLV